MSFYTYLFPKNKDTVHFSKSGNEYCYDPIILNDEHRF
jgi:hypothetical protein